MIRPFVLLFAAAAMASAQSSLAPPLIGIVRDPMGQVRRIFGVSSNLIYGPVERTGVVAAEFTGRSGMIKTETELVLLDGLAQPQRSLPAPPGPAVFEFDAEGMPLRCRFADGESWSASDARPEAAPRAELVDGEVRIRLVDGTWRTVTLPAPSAAPVRMGDSWLAAPPFAIQLTPRGARVYRLPATEAKQ